MANNESGNGRDPWQQDNHPMELYGRTFIDQKIAYIHRNPVDAGLVRKPEAYRLSSARNYIGQQGLVDVQKL